MGIYDPHLEIIYDGKPATTVAIAAARQGTSPKSMLNALRRLGIGPLSRVDGGQYAGIDNRTPIYALDEVERALGVKGERPGRKAGVPNAPVPMDTPCANCGAPRADHAGVLSFGSCPGARGRAASRFKQAKAEPEGGDEG